MATGLSRFLPWLARDAARGQRVTTLIGEHVRVVGSVVGTGCGVRVDGEVQGDVVAADSLVLIGSGGTVVGRVTAHVAVIQGRVVGDISAAEKVEILSKGVVVGDVRAPKVDIAPGADFDGKVVTRVQDIPDGDSADPGVTAAQALATDPVTAVAPTSDPSAPEVVELEVLEIEGVPMSAAGAPTALAASPAPAEDATDEKSDESLAALIALAESDPIAVRDASATTSGLLAAPQPASRKLVLVRERVDAETADEAPGEEARPRPSLRTLLSGRRG